jgi:hypothetical protein
MAAPDEETALEVGLLATVLLLLTAGLALLFGRISERREGARGRSTHAPDVGEVPRSRHSNINSASPR